MLARGIIAVMEAGEEERNLKSIGARLIVKMP